jgi:hypothetical protein
MEIFVVVFSVLGEAYREAGAVNPGVPLFCKSLMAGSCVP